VRTCWGLPHLDPDPVGYHAIVLSLAAKLGRPIDVHTDETLDPAVQHLSHLAGLVAETGVSHGVTASH
jgi:cytosine deaminase